MNEGNYIPREDLDQVTQRFNQRNQQSVGGGDRKGHHPKSHRGPLDFSALAMEGNRFINEVSNELDISRARAARITRAVLHALRDRLPPDDSIEFAQGLPLVMKGVWLDQYDISSTPVVCRTKSDFFTLLDSKAAGNTHQDFPTDRHREAAVRGVFRVLQQFMDPGQTEQIKNMIGGELRSVIE